jgi:hypothetical protein
VISFFAGYRFKLLFSIFICRVVDYTFSVARNALTYNFPAMIALETVEVLKRYVVFVETFLMIGTIRWPVGRSI